MGFWSRLFGKPEQDTTVADYQALAASGGPFRMTVEDVFVITGRGTVVTGIIETGTLNVGESVTVHGAAGPRVAKVTGIEAFREVLTSAPVGARVGLVLDGITRKDAPRGTVLTRS